MTLPIGDEKFACAFDISVWNNSCLTHLEAAFFPHWGFLSPAEVGGHSAGNVAYKQGRLDAPWLTAKMNSFWEEDVS